MVQAVTDAFFQKGRHFLHGLLAQVLADGVAPQGKGQTCVVVPPFAQVDDERQAVVGVSQLPLMDNQPGIDLAPGDDVEDLIEGTYNIRETVSQKSRKAKKAVVSSPGMAMVRSISQSGSASDAGNDHWPVIVPHAGARRSRGRTCR